MKHPNCYLFLDVNVLADRIKKWREEKGFDTDKENIPEKLALIHSEISEALEAHRSDGLSYFFDKNQKPQGLPSELADAIIRLLDLAASLDIDIAAAISDKMNYNETRPHKHGKKY